VQTKLKITLVLIVAGVLSVFALSNGGGSRTQASPRQVTPQPPPLSPQDKQIVNAFEKRAKQYAKFREQLEERMPKLSKEAKPEEIEAHKKQFQERVRAGRAGARRGNVFTPEASQLIRRMIKDEFKGRERVELRDTVLREADTKAVPLRVNYPYPETQELLEMPATLLLRLPQLPKQLRYRFVGPNMLLVDRENGLIVDYLTNALP
jgi:flagellar basal body-associated protein FliL